MAQFILNIPDAAVTRVVNALCAAGHWKAGMGVTKVEFARAEAARLIRERVSEQERRDIASGAAAAAAAVDEPTIT